LPHCISEALHFLKSDLIELLEKGVLVPNFVLRGFELTAEKH
jgi:hypothetical protein